MHHLPQGVNPLISPPRSHYLDSFSGETGQSFFQNALYRALSGAGLLLKTGKIRPVIFQA